MRTGKVDWTQVWAIPVDFFHGFIGGLIGPLMALAGVIGFIYLFTKRLPALKEVQRGDGSSYKAILLTSPLEARASWARYGGELRGVLLQLRARAQSRRDDL